MSNTLAVHAHHGFYSLERPVYRMFNRFVKDVREEGHDGQTSDGGTPPPDFGILDVLEQRPRIFHCAVDRQGWEQHTGRPLKRGSLDQGYNSAAAEVSRSLHVCRTRRPRTHLAQLRLLLLLLSKNVCIPRTL